MLCYPLFRKDLLGVLSSVDTRREINLRQLFDRLTEAVKREMPNEFEMRRLEQDAKALMAREPAKAHQILGGLAAVRWDVTALKHHHEQALTYPHGVWAYRNYGISLQVVGMFPEAAVQMLRAAEKQPENLTFLQTAAGHHMWAGNPRKALELNRELYKRTLDEDARQKVASFIETLEDLLRLTQAHGISDDELRTALSIAFDLLRERKVRATECNLVVSLDEDCAFLRISIDLPPKQVYELDVQLGQRLAEQLSDMHSALVIELRQPRKPAPRAHDGQAARVS